ncbi:unnamed protein product [Periconia digitata]|uniref:Uncharacterized protein n=1 Tax=Periconia digitata TaxID=1303443 RepID=A0A9W4U6T0_9PLEO|nr:unnamed protein product [Periconia digitata]
MSGWSSVPLMPVTELLDAQGGHSNKCYAVTRGNCGGSSYWTRNLPRYHDYGGPTQSSALVGGFCRSDVFNPKPTPNVGMRSHHHIGLAWNHGFGAAPWMRLTLYSRGLPIPLDRKAIMRLSAIYSLVLTVLYVAIV